jgi:hypothetical protein
MNINPFRVGTTFINVLDDIELRFSQFAYSSKQLKLLIMNKLINVFNAYYDPLELAPLIEEKDYYSKT